MASYRATHRHLVRERGEPTETFCALHGEHFGAQWSYTHLATDEKTEVYTSGGSYPYRNRYHYLVPYSEELYGDYISLCVAAHTQFDRIHKNAAKTITGDEDETGFWLL